MRREYSSKEAPLSSLQRPTADFLMRCNMTQLSRNLTVPVSPGGRCKRKIIKCSTPFPQRDSWFTSPVRCHQPTVAHAIVWRGQIVHGRIRRQSLLRLRGLHNVFGGHQNCCRSTQKFAERI